MRTNTHDNGHGGAYVRKCEERALVHVCSPMAFIVALLAVLLVPTIALADSSVIWGPSVLPSQDIGVVVNAPDKYRAAALVLGYGDDKVSTWSDEVLAKLSNESTGGAFYTFAQKFGEVDDAVGNDNLLTSVVSAVGNSFWAIAETLYGDEIWLAGYSAFEFSSAASALSSILAGENIGGGGSGDVAAEFTFNGANNYRAQVNWSQSFIDNINARSWDFTLSTAAVDAIQSHIDDYPYVYARGVPTTNSTDIKVTKVAIIMTSQPLVPDVQSYTVALTTTDCWYWETSNKNYVHGSTTALDFQTLSHATSSKSFGDISLWCTGISDIAGGGGDPVVPPTNWPDEPSAPTPPELPEPGTNPTVTPTPWAPVISPTFDFDLNITTEPTSNDLIDWVKKIYYELRSFHSDEKDWFDEIGNGIDAIVDAIDDAQEQIYGELQNVDETLRSEGQKIRDYMYQMFHWLKDQLNFQNDPFDDNNIVYWLKRIWSKLGDGDVNVRPVDPTVDPPAWWEWLNKMLDSLLDGLVGVFNELLGGTGDLLEEVIHQFPFSIPWDIAAFLTALAAAPVTPVFDIVIPAVDGWWSQITFHIDMTPYNTAAATVRLMTKLVFAGLLAWKSRELLNMMDVTKW